MNLRVTVVGAGVIGLTTAVVLERAGHEVTVVAKDKGFATTSAAAGAVWLPYRVGPPDRALVWARRTRDELTRIARSCPEAGVDMIEALLVADVDTPPWWAPAVDDLALVTSVRAFVSNRVWKMLVPRCDPTVYLGWLESHLTRPILRRHVEELESLEGDIIVHCSGVGARTLARDPELVANLGQTVVVAGGSLDPSLMLSDDRDPQAMFYAIPRRSEVVLGGCAIPVDAQDAPPPDPALAEAIVERCRRSGFDPGAVLYTRSGLRPVRREVRLEREGRIVHNYGHGGAGYTLSWACAEDVAELAARG